MKLLIVALTLFLSQPSFAMVMAPGKLKLLEASNKHGLEFYVVQMNGAIAYPMAIEFQELLEKMGKKDQPLLLDLNSGGGSYQEGMKIIALIRREAQNGRPIRSTVQNGAMCGSMCVPIYLQGKVRFAGEVSSFMFHGMTSGLMGNIPDEKKTREGLNIFIDSGVSAAWLEKMWERGAFSKPGQYWMSGKELMDEESGIPTELLSRHEIQAPRESPVDPQIRPR